MDKILHVHFDNGTEFTAPEHVISRLSSYHYIPTRSVAIIMLALFGISTLVHLGQALRYRMFWLLPTVCLCGIGEILGWSGRLWSSFEPLLSIPFEIQITATIVAPTPFLAANFVIFGHLIERLGYKYSRLSPKWYTIIFCTCDVVSLFVQGAGGGIAATSDDLAGANNGAHIMLGGIAFQLVVIIFFSTLAIEYFIRYNLDKPVRSEYSSSMGKLVSSDSQVNLENGANTGIQKAMFRGQLTRKRLIMSWTLAFTTLLLFVRAIYRLAELGDGWRGRIISNQLYFNVLDATMIILVMFAANAIHPGHFLSEPPHAELEQDSYRLKESQGIQF